MVMTGLLFAGIVGCLWAVLYVLYVRYGRGRAE
jgi:hypothetical protein